MRTIQRAGVTEVPAEKRNLGLVSGSRPETMGLKPTLHLIFSLLPFVLVRLPLHILFRYAILRDRDNVYREIGRPWSGEYARKICQYLITNCYAAAYSKWGEYKEWSSARVSVNGTTGRWIAPPGTKRSEDQVVLYYVHRGGFVLDTAGAAQYYFLFVAKEMNIKRNVQFSVFQLDYELAPEFKFPSQQIEIQAGYHYLVNNQGIDPKKIVVSGDSAGGNLVASWLLHVARPCSVIKVPAELGPTPPRPGGVLLISPYLRILSSSTSSYKNIQYDSIGLNATFYPVLDYIGIHDVSSLNMPAWSEANGHGSPDAAQKVTDSIPFTPGDEAKGGLGLLKSPYVNPSMCEDPKWLAEAYPGGGCTAVSWGGKELLADDVAQVVDEMEKAGVALVRLVKELGVHDWIVYDSTVPGLWKTKTGGREDDPNYNVLVTADFLQSFFERTKQTK
ncbi:BQ2448_7985 [Microbotryum intermedium]|uniref:BQ2448_7985 protein n=1 Tax=Microbotryum intermedium TaxID=269621 RepID=A0A238FV71_9BASI|nr:BQ2448_7985 [Microbotryum intermedium]